MLLETVFWGSAAAALYHHAVYPALLGRLHPAKPDHAPAPTDARPTVSVIVAAYQEEAWIAAKVRNLLALDWPADRLRIRIVCDGCTDATARLARAAIEDSASPIDITVEEHDANRGKVAVLNDAIGE